MVQPPLDGPDLLSWPEAAKKLTDRPALLLGNGGSRAVWQGFGYESLFKLASAVSEPRLQEGDLALFAELDTRDFERVLGALSTTERVARALGLGTRHVREHYRSVQQALAGALATAHVPWERAESVLTTLKDAFRAYSRVYTTNYDLLLYWAVMYQDPTGSGFVDFFWSSENFFDPNNVEVHTIGRTELYYLHGAIHLRKTGQGRSRKETASESRSLLDFFTSPITAEETPLLVSEGSSEEKRRSIRESDYLNFALDRFRADVRDIVVFGHGLGSPDSHIWRGIDGSNRRIAVSVRPSGLLTRQAKLGIAQKLPDADLLLFDATSHPLGSPGLLRAG